MWTLLEEHLRSVGNRELLVYTLAILTNLCFDDESCLQIRMRCAYSVCQLMIQHILKLNASIKGKYVLLLSSPRARTQRLTRRAAKRCC